LRSGRLKSLSGVLSLIVLFSFPCVVEAQQANTSDLLKYFQGARTKQIATEVAMEGQLRLPFLAAEPLETKAKLVQLQFDELNWKRLLASLPEPLETFGVSSMRLITRLESPAYENLFEEAEWSFVGSSSRSAIDTLKTADIRSRLELRYGSPTRTLAETGYPDSLKKEEIIQFEYWFLANGTIPVIVMDVNGPWDRGIVLAAEMKYRAKLDLIKKSILEQLSLSPERKQFIDYYYNFDSKTWYVSGFDGASFFDKRIQRPNLSLGRPSPSIISDRLTDN
jgi:hypothetical protein